MAKKRIEKVVSPEVPEIAIPLQDKGPKVVKVTPEELARLQEEKRLIGYDPVTCMATIS